MSQVNRRDWLKTVGLGLGAMALPGWLGAREGTLLQRAIPATGERLPIVGLGSSATFRQLASHDDVSALRAVLNTLFEHGGKVVDTAPSYGSAEEVAGHLVQELDALDEVFWATKLNVAGRGGGKADREAARAQLEQSFQRIGKPVIDLIQVHNLADIPTQMGLLKELKQDGKVRYIGTTYTWEDGYPELARVMKEEPIDFIGVDYAIDNREAAETILPLAMDRGIAVLVYVPFGRTRLWNRVDGRALPEWAGEIGAESWAQFFLKFIAAHPAVSCITPATSKPKHMLDNMGAAYGELPDEAMLQRMVEYVEGLPEA